MNYGSAKSLELSRGSTKIDLSVLIGQLKYILK